MTFCRKGEWMVRMIVVGMCVAVACSSASWAAVWYVDAGNSEGPHDGTSWDTAFVDIQSAVDAASGDGGGDLWVAAGIYTSSAAAVVTMAADVHLYGGFAGTEDEREQRDHEANTTVIDGETARRGVVAADSATLDGFTITRGNDSGNGGGIYIDGCSPAIANCVFRNNEAEYGGAMYLTDGGPSVVNCRFIDNLAQQSGGAVITGDNTATFTECLFTGNVCIWRGGAMFVGGSTTVLTVDKCVFATNEGFATGGAVALRIGEDAEADFTDCLFVGNYVIANDGGAIDKYYGTLSAKNCVFLGNAAPWGGGVHCWGYETIELINCTLSRNFAEFTGGNLYVGCDVLRITNSILWGGVAMGHYDRATDDIYISQNAGGTVDITYTDITDGSYGTGNFDADPLFRPAPAGTTTALSFDMASFTSTITDATASFTPGTLEGLAVLIESDDPYVGPGGYVIVDNTATAITVWGDVTQNGTVDSPRTYEILNWRLRGSSPCVDAGCDTSGAQFGSITTDLDGDLRGFDGLDDGPTGPPAPGDGSDYDIGADEYMGGDEVFNPYDINRDGFVNAVDVQLVINAALNLIQLADADVNGDSQVNAVDVQLVINAALGLI